MRARGDRWRPRSRARPDPCGQRSIECRESAFRLGVLLHEDSIYLGTALGTPQSLQALGLKVSDLDRAADLAVTHAYWNPRPVEREGVRQLLETAFYGRLPG